MNKYYVTYDQAIILKSLNYDEECQACYNEDKVLVRMLPLVSNTKYPKFPSAPLYDQILDWCRVQHDLYVVVEPKMNYPDKSIATDAFSFSIFDSLKGYNEELGLNDGVYSMDDIRPVIVTRLLELISNK